MMKFGCGGVWDLGVEESGQIPGEGSTGECERPFGGIGTGGCRLEGRWRDPANVKS